MTQPQLQDLLEAGVHFGHQTRRWNPKMRRFIFAERSGIYLIDLHCTKRQLNQIVKVEADRCGAFWVTERWLGGTLTNFQTIKRQIRRLRELEQGQDEGAFEFFTKKEQLHFDRERQKLNRNLEGIKNMSRVPGAIFVVDAKKERIAIAEANKLGIPVVAIVDTNADPDLITLITVPIPGNDDAIRSVSLITGALVDVIAEARKEVPVREAASDSEAYSTYSTESEEADEEDSKRRRRPRRKRRPKPEAIAARLKVEEDQAGKEQEGAAEAPQEAAETKPAALEAAETKPAAAEAGAADEGGAEGAAPGEEQG
jgi:small subunit ribosomal protein S2